MFRPWALRLLLLFLSSVLIAACGIGTSAGAHAGYSLSVQSGAKTLKRFDLAALQALPAANVETPQSSGQKVQHGPLVRTVLARAGVHQFSRLRVVGQDGSQTFTSAEVGDQVVLGFTHRGTVKLAGAHLPQSRWVPNVKELDIE